MQNAEVRMHPARQCVRHCIAYIKDRAGEHLVHSNSCKTTRVRQNLRTSIICGSDMYSTLLMLCTLIAHLLFSHVVSQGENQNDSTVMVAMEKFNLSLRFNFESASV